MECGVFDKIQSNFLPRCALCGFDISSPFNSSKRLLDLCENCGTAVNNNSLSQEQHDCLLAESPTSPLGVSNVGQACLCFTHNNNVVRDPYRRGLLSGPCQCFSDSHPSSLEFNIDRSGECQRCYHVATACRQANQSCKSAGTVLFGSSPTSRDQSVTCGESEIHHKHTLRLCEDTKYHDQCMLENDARVCLNSKTVPLIADVCGNQTAVPCIINENGSPAVLHNTPPKPHRLKSPLTPTSPCNVNKYDLTARTTSTWKFRSRRLFPASCNHNLQELVTHLDLASAADINVHADPHLRGQHESAQQYSSCAQTINHNMEHNKVTTSNITRIPNISFGPRKSHHLHTYATHCPLTRDSLGSSSVPRIFTQDFHLSMLPTEVLNVFDQENEDLSADMVYSLHLRNYTIGEVLGRGISSTVRRVTEKQTGVEYAVKIIDISGEKGELHQVDQVKKDTFREISILRMCAGHNNIIELQDVFETPTFIFLVFEICKKGELFDFLTSVVSLSEKRTRIFMRQLLEAVAYFHDKNIVHRDLKPENILLDDMMNIKVSDFGFAVVLKDGEELSELCGTPGYLAPEVLACSMYEDVRGYSKEVDMWACGVIMYTLLCGAPPFWHRRQMIMLRSIMSADYTFNSPEWDDIAETTKDLIRKLLVVNPKERLTAKETLRHPFFESNEPVYEQLCRLSFITYTYGITEKKTFNAIRKFRAGVQCVVFYLRLNFYSKHPPPVSVAMVRDNPYGIKIMRKVIDTCAFGMYKHWVKRVDNQNRAALFEHTLRDDWKHALLIVEGIRA